MKISFFYTPKPRQFKYQPRFYDPEQEKFEELKNKYKLTRNYEEMPKDENDDLVYFKSRVKSFDSKKRESDFTLVSLFRKKQMPTFNYKPRFSQEANTDSQTVANENGDTVSSIDQLKYSKKISFRRPIAYDYEDESPIAERMPISKILVYGTVIILLLLWIFL